MKLNNLFHAILAGVAAIVTSTSAACINVSIETDATYCINGPTCSCSRSTPAGGFCPTKGAVAVKDCNNNKLPSWTSGGICVAPSDAVCVKIKTGARGCVYATATISNATANATSALASAPTAIVKATNTSSNTTSNSTAVTPASTTTAKSINTTLNSSSTSWTPSNYSLTPNKTCIYVSVESDATYCIQGPICSGSGSTPAGSLCPTKGTAAVKDCSNNKLPSWTSAGTCVAPADEVCAKIKTGAWGCMYGAAKPGNGTSNSSLTTNSAATPTPAVKVSNNTTNSTSAPPGNKPTSTTAATSTAPTTKPAVTPAVTTTAPTAKPSSSPVSTTAAPATATTTFKPSPTAPVSTTAAPTAKPTTTTTASSSYPNSTTAPTVTP
ncbi:unnamed protein product [Phytophthora lilii]|uniref:Unnamed protein product n=1 Tax=Phytophthora lilii TaxID=2077276 RepID=A0A9W6X2G5_9STRA|nr:unnamed protein product [Phytophthora lilii]